MTALSTLMALGKWLEFFSYEMREHQVKRRWKVVGYVVGQELAAWRACGSMPGCGD